MCYRPLRSVATDVLCERIETLLFALVVVTIGSDVAKAVTVGSMAWNGVALCCSGPSCRRVLRCRSSPHITRPLALISLLSVNPSPLKPPSLVGVDEAKILADRSPGRPFSLLKLFLDYEPSSVRNLEWHKRKRPRHLLLLLLLRRRLAPSQLPMRLSALHPRRSSIRRGRAAAPL
jgi:hypothetical protein